MEWIEVSKDTMPETEGRYIVRTKSPRLNTENAFLCRLYFSQSGKSFDCHNQIVTHWLNEN